MLTLDEWCHDNDYVRSGVRVSKLPSSKESGVLNLYIMRMKHRSECMISLRFNWVNRFHMSEVVVYQR